jgi:hypothetical protein
MFEKQELAVRSTAICYCAEGTETLTNFGRLPNGREKVRRCIFLVNRNFFV